MSRINLAPDRVLMMRPPQTYQFLSCDLLCDLAADRPLILARLAGRLAGWLYGCMAVWLAGQRSSSLAPPCSSLERLEPERVVIVTWSLLIGLDRGGGTGPVWTKNPAARLTNGLAWLALVHTFMSGPSFSSRKRNTLFKRSSQIVLGSRIYFPGCTLNLT